MNEKNRGLRYPEDAEGKSTAIVLLAIILMASAMGCGMFLYQFGMPNQLRSSTTEVRFFIPHDFYVSYYDYDNLTLMVEYSYSVYLIAVSGNESPKIDVSHNKNFIDQYLLSWFLDIEIYNMSIYNESMAFNGESVSLEFRHDLANHEFLINAIDLSLYNGTDNLKSMDFGNPPFANVALGQRTDVFINGIFCRRIAPDVFRPYLNFTISGNEHWEKMAWNNIMPLP